MSRMVQPANLPAGEDHPVALELASLKVAVTRFQDEAQSSALKLQRHALENTLEHARLMQLERENGVLKTELATLRVNPHPDASPQSHPAVMQAQQLTLSLRHLSEKLSLTENALLERTTELATAKSEAMTAKLAAEAAYELAAKVRGREEAGKVRERDLEWKIKAVEEELKMSDSVLKEYADLVRSLEGRSSIRSPGSSSHSHSSSTGSNASTLANGNGTAGSLADGLEEGKQGLRKLLSELHAETDKLHTELDQVHGKLSEFASREETYKKTLHVESTALAKAQFELQKLKIDDSTAAKMVSRYMRFSQKSTDILQEAMKALKTRHAVTIDTLSSQIYSLSSQLRESETLSERLRGALDELGGEIMKETYGRRREVALRIRMVNREEKLHEGLKRWIRRSEEALSRISESEGERTAGHDELLTMAQDARILLESLDGPVTDFTSLSGSLGRMIATQNAVAGLMEELQEETARRIELEQALAAREQELHKVERERGETLLVNGGLAGVVNGHALKTDGSHPKDLPPTPKPIENGAASSGSSMEPVPPQHLDIQISLSPVQTTLKESDATSVSSASIPDQSQFASLDIQIPSLKTTPEESVLASVVSVSPLVESQPTDSGAQEPITERILSSFDAVDELSAPASASAERTTEISVVEEPQESPITESSSPSSGSTTSDSQDLLEDVAHKLETYAAPEHPSTPIEPAPDADTAGLQAPDESSVLSELEDSEGNDAIPIPPASPQLTVAQPSPRSAKFAHLTAVLEASVISDEGSKPPSPVSSPVAPETTQLQPYSDLDDDSHPTPITPHPLLAELNKVEMRYEELQKGFRDCHMSLEDLKKSIFPSPGGGGGVAFPSSVQRRIGGIPTEILHTALDRINDYIEDARVELEIRTSDEALLAHGYETLLSVPGALGSKSTSSALNGDHEGDDSLSQSEAELQIEAFIAGTEPSIQRAMEGFRKKLEDIQHDIAALKRAIHEPDFGGTQASTPLSSALPSGKSESSSSSWTSWIRGGTPSRPDSPAGPSPTFGNIMTNPRLRHAPSLNFQRSLSGAANGLGYDYGAARDPLSSLGLRVPMPNFSGHLLSSPDAAVNQGPQRTRTVSTMYMLGLGARSPSGSFTPLGSPQRRGSAAHVARAPLSAEEEEEETDDGGVETETEDEDETDVE